MTILTAEATKSATQSPQIVAAKVTWKRVPQKTKADSLKATNARFAANHDALLKLAEENTRRLTGRSRF